MSTTSIISARSLVAGAAAAALVLAAGCSSNSSETSSDTSAQHHESTSQVDTAATHNDADVSFANGMIPHHQQAVVMSDIILGKQGIDARVVDLANQVKAAQEPEIATMKQWLTDWHAPVMNHHGHDMTSMGMMTEQQLEQLRQAQGVDATRQFLTGMIAHHEGAVRMAQTELDTGKAEEARKLAQEIIESQQREIDTMKQILGSL